MIKKQDDIAKARKQLLVIGVICITIVVFALWIVNLNKIFNRNQQIYNGTLEPFKKAYDH